MTEVALLGAPWGFRPEDITMAVHLWDGDQNRLIPRTHAQYLARALPQSQLTVCPGEGHLLIVDHMDEILRAALGGAGEQQQPGIIRPLAA